MLFPQSCSPVHMCVGGTFVWLEFVCLHFRARHWYRHAAGTTHVVRPCFEGLSGRRLHVVTGVVLRGLALPSRSLAGQANPLWTVTYRTSATLLTPAGVVAFADQAPRGQRVPLDNFRTLLIDLSAESVESFLSSRSKTWRRSCGRRSPARARGSLP